FDAALPGYFLRRTQQVTPDPPTAEVRVDGQAHLELTSPFGAEKSDELLGIPAQDVLGTVATISALGRHVEREIEPFEAVTPIDELIDPGHLFGAESGPFGKALTGRKVQKTLLHGCG